MRNLEKSSMKKNAIREKIFKAIKANPNITIRDLVAVSGASSTSHANHHVLCLLADGAISRAKFVVNRMHL
jgi:hypothetical protein